MHVWSSSHYHASPGPAYLLAPDVQHSESGMEISNRHNLIDPPENREKRYGIRVYLAESDPFRRLLQDSWETFHWYADAAERDRAITNMSKRHRYSRTGDRPSVQYEPVER